MNDKSGFLRLFFFFAFFTLAFFLVPATPV